MMNRYIAILLVTAVFISAMPIQGMGFARRLVGSRSAIAAARTAVARVGSSVPAQVARIPQAVRVAQPARISQLLRSAQSKSYSPIFNLVREASSTACAVRFAQLSKYARGAGAAVIVGTGITLCSDTVEAVDDAHGLPRDLKRIIDAADHWSFSAWLRMNVVGEALWQRIIKYCCEHLAELSKGFGGSFLLREIMEENAASVRVLAQGAADNIVELVKNYCGQELLKDIMEKDAAAAQVLVQSAVDNIVAMYEQEYGSLFLKEIIEKHPESVELFAQAAEKAGIQTDFPLIIQLQAKQSRGELLSPSEAHLSANKHLVLQKLLPKDVQQLQHTILMDEHRLIDGGHVPFYHAQSNEKWFPIEVDTFLHGIQTGEAVDGFYLMHTRRDSLREQACRATRESDVALHKPIMYDHLMSEDALECERLIRHGRQSADDRNRMLFLNGALRGNAGYFGSQSFPYYFMENWNAGDHYQQNASIMRDMFVHRGLGSVYKQFKNELQQLHDEYIELSEYGTLYQIAVPADKVSKMVCPVIAGGGKTQLTVGDEVTDDMRKIGEASRDPKTHPGDINEFVAMMTYDENGLMNPKCGAKIKAYMIPTDEAKYQEWCAKWEDLKVRMKAEVERTRPADYIAPAHAQALVEHIKKGYEQAHGARA